MRAVHEYAEGKQLAALVVVTHSGSVLRYRFTRMDDARAVTLREEQDRHAATQLFVVEHGSGGRRRELVFRASDVRVAEVYLEEEDD